MSLDDERVTFKLSDFKEHVCSLTNNLEQLQREIQDEIPYCRWLYDYVGRILRPQFVVTSQEENVPIQFETYEAEQINEYSSSQSDLVIYKAQEWLKSMDCCVISLQASALIGCRIKTQAQDQLPDVGMFSQHARCGNSHGCKEALSGYFIGQIHNLWAGGCG